MSNSVQRLWETFAFNKRQQISSEVAEMVRSQLETLPDGRNITIKNLTINVHVNYCSGGGAKLLVQDSKPRPWVWYKETY